MTAGYLLDTSVVSLLAPGRPDLAPDLAAWLRTNTDRLFLSAVTIAEIEQGIGKLRRAGGTERASLLTAWLDALMQDGGERILALDGRAGRIAGALSDQAQAAGRHPDFPDIAIAAIAVAHDLHLLTRNGKHFAPLGIAFTDPVERLP